MTKVLIFTCRHEKKAVDRVCALLGKQQFIPVVVYTEDILTGKLPIAIELSDQGTRVTVNGISLSVEDIGSAWYRRPLGYRWLDDDAGKQLGLRQEYRESLQTLWNMIPEDRWVNSPWRMYRAERKLWQLEKAKTCGFEIPRTVVTTRYADIMRSLKTDHIVLKSHRGRLFINNKLHIMHTTIVPRRLADLKKLGSPFPGIWQEYMPKKREWRVTVVGGKVFPVSIYTEPSAKADWRMYQGDRKKVEFKSEVLSKVITEQCKRFLQEAGLSYGAFDFIETPDGRVIFLEVNANGQFLVFEDMLGLSISTAIADRLMALARSSG